MSKRRYNTRALLDENEGERSETTASTNEVSEPASKNKKTTKVGKRSKPTAGEDDKYQILYRMLRRHTLTFESRLDTLQNEMRGMNKMLMSTPTDSSSDEPMLNGATTSSNSHERILYNISNVNLEKPKFDRNKPGQHPVAFIEDLIAYMRKVPSTGQKLELVQECLVGEARDWARIFRLRWTTFEDFKRDFLSTFWGEVEQSRVRRDIVANKWERKDSSSMLSHFLKLTGQARMLTFPMPEPQLVSDIMRHYSKYVQQLWVMSKGSTVIEATEFLRNMDEINKQGESTPRVTENHKEKEYNNKKQEYNKNYKNWKQSDTRNSSTAKTAAEISVDVDALRDEESAIVSRRSDEEQEN